MMRSCHMSPPTLPHSLISRTPPPPSPFPSATNLFPPLTYPSHFFSSFYHSFFLLKRNQAQYEITAKLGRGKYSEVFAGYNMVDNSQYVTIDCITWRSSAFFLFSQKKSVCLLFACNRGSDDDADAFFFLFARNPGSTLSCRLGFCDAVL